MSTTQFDGAKLEAFCYRLFGAAIGAVELVTVYIGDKLGLYQSLSESGPVTSTELAKRTGLAERPLREWLDQQTIAGIIESDGNKDQTARQYSISPEHAVGLTDKNSPAYVSVLAKIVKVVGGILPDLVESFRTGAGVPYAAYGADGIDAQAEFNRPSFINSLVAEWVPAVPGLKERLSSKKTTKVADVACGAGLSAIVLAKAFPNIHIDGYDLDEASIAIARKNAAEEGVADRVQFHVRDARDPKLAGTYDVVTVFEAIHDMGDPVAGLSTVNRLLAPGGIALVADERPADEFAVPGDEMERMFYGCSVLWCLPQGLADGPDAHGTVMRTSDFTDYALKAGWSSVDVLPIEHPMLRFYHLIP